MTPQESTPYIPERFRFDGDALRQYLLGVVPQLSGGFEISKFSGGQSNPTYLLQSADSRYVLRRKPPGAVLSTAHAIDREARVMKALAPTGFPVPAVVHECTNADIIGSPFYIMSFLDGRIFWDQLLDGTERAERAPIYFALTDTLADLHAVDIDAVGLGDFGPRTGYFNRQIQRWSSQMQAVGRYPTEAGRLVDWLTSHVPADDAIVLVHGDYRIDNVVFDYDAPSLIGVIDWELATLGNPMADLSYFLLSWILPVNHTGGPSLGSSDLASLGIPTAEAIIDRYFARSTHSRPDSFAFYYAYNLFRAAAILHGISARHRSGNASSEHDSGLGAFVSPLLEFAGHVVGL
ncbi:aminoglycoside phosphotransferase (APT) family kinase protein [Mycobacterium sp. MAA66]|uniref:phosphotransferase family protein n=1 Tax=Mycobacterium sp. MAA66 TaxID=3156297 RepID=UPI00351536AB